MVDLNDIFSEIALKINEIAYLMLQAKIKFFSLSRKYIFRENH